MYATKIAENLVKYLIGDLLCCVDRSPRGYIMVHIGLSHSRCLISSPQARWLAQRKELKAFEIFVKWIMS